jgi:hypothetical protein
MCVPDGPGTAMTVTAPAPRVKAPPTGSGTLTQGQRPTQAALEDLAVSERQGLTTGEAVRRRAQWDPNPISTEYLEKDLPRLGLSGPFAFLGPSLLRMGTMLNSFIARGSPTSADGIIRVSGPC